MWWVDNYHLSYFFAGPPDRALYGNVSSSQAYHLLPSVFYLFLKKYVRLDCWDSWSNVLENRLCLGLSNLVSFCIVSLFSQHVCSFFLEDARHLLSLFSDHSTILTLCYALFWHSKYQFKTLCILLHLAQHSI